MAVRFVSSLSPVVLIDYKDVSNPSCDLSASIETAFGDDGLGILVVRGIPRFEELRGNLLPLAMVFARLTETEREKYEHPLSHYSFGWSHGKETLVGGVPDFGKGSFYANPLYDDPFKDEPQMKSKYPSFCSPNIWPMEVPMLQSAFMSLGRLIVSVGSELALHCDKYVASKCPSYTEQCLTRIVKESRNPKARLLHYFPSDDPVAVSAAKEFESKINKSDEFGSWCGWHNDHGSLTGLTSAMFFDQTGNHIQPPTDSSGLYIKSRKGDIVKATIPSDCLAFQMGETQQILSGGILQATPHAVKSSAANGVSRETFAVFMEPEIGESMRIPLGTSKESVLKGSAVRYLPPGVPPLDSRWENGITFGEFTNRTLDGYHPNNEKAKLVK